LVGGKILLVNNSMKNIPISSRLIGKIIKNPRLGCLLTGKMANNLLNSQKWKKKTMKKPFLLISIYHLVIKNGIRLVILST